MKITEIPFNKLVGISESSDAPDVLEITYRKELGNHLDTFHAGVQYLLAEACCGHFLINLFPDYPYKVLPIVTKSAFKYKKPATESIHAKAYADKEKVTLFLSRFARKSRGVISIEVKVIDQEDHVTSQGEFQWFIQKIGE